MKRAAWVVLALVAAAQLIPVWVVRFQPLPDMPVHLAAVSVWHNYTNPAYDFQRYFTLELGACPYWGYYLLVHLLAFLAGIDVANRIVLSLYLLGMPFGFAVLARRFGRSPALALFALPLAWNWNFAMGFVTFCVGLTLLPFALTAFDRFCERATVGRGLLAALLGVGVFFCHLLPWGIYLATAGLIGLLHEGRTLRQLGWRALVWAPSLLIGVWVVRHGSGVQMGGAVAHGISVAMVPFHERVDTFRYFVLDLWFGSEDEWLALALVVVWLALVASARWRRPRLHDLRPVAGALVCLVAYFVLPRSIVRPFPWWGINFRFAAPACLFAALCVPGELGARRRWLLAPVAAIAVLYVALTVGHWRRIDHWLDGLDELARRPAPTEPVLVLQFPPIEHDMRASPHRLGALRQAYYGGFFAEDFEQDFPLAYKRRLPAPPWQQPERFNMQQYGRHYQWLLAFQPPADFLVGESRATPAGTSGLWKLWRLPPPVD